jgi:hypothetical protein
MAAPKRSAGERDRDLDRIAELYLQGKTQSEIAASLGKERAYAVTQQTISRDLSAIEARWATASEAKLDAAKAKELAKIDSLERTYWTAWEASCKAKTISSAEESKGGTGKRASSMAKKSVRKEERDGNPAFLAGVLECIQRRCRLLGLDAPEKHNITGSIDIAASIIEVCGIDNTVGAGGSEDQRVPV